MRYVARLLARRAGVVRRALHLLAGSDLASLLGIGGIWIWAFIGQLKGQTIIPIHETWVEEAIREGALKVNA